MSESFALSILSAALTAVLGAIPGLREALPTDARAAVDALLARAKATLPAQGSAGAAIAQLFAEPAIERTDAEAIAAATGIPRADVVRVMRAHAQLRGAPPVLRAPEGAWSDPNNEED